MTKSQLLSIDDNEWKNAEEYFRTHTNENKYSKNSEGVSHTFYRGMSFNNGPGGQLIVAVANMSLIEERKHKLGEGAFGRVKVAQDKEGNCFAIKLEQSNTGDTLNSGRELASGIGFLKKLGTYRSSDNLSNDKQFSILELKKGKELEKKIYFSIDSFFGIRVFKKNLSTKDKLFAALSASSSIQSIHDLGYVHSDIKPANFMYNKENGLITVSAIDFDLSRKVGEIYLGGTPFYSAPEIFQSVNPLLNTNQDIFSLGRVFLEDFDIDNDIVEDMVNVNPSQRPNIYEVQLKLMAELLNRKDLTTRERTDLEDKKNILIGILKRDANSNSSLIDNINSNELFKSKIDRITSKEDLNSLYNEYRYSRKSSSITGMMYNQFKSTSHLLSDRNNIRNEQIDKLYNAINAYQASNIIDKEIYYGNLMYLLDSLMKDTKKGSFTSNEFNLLNSGLHQLCSDIKGELKAKHPEFSNKQSVSQSNQPKKIN